MTGGLADNVKEFDPTEGTGNGFVFGANTSKNLFQCIQRALRMFSDKDAWGVLVKNAQSQDRSWTLPAMEYVRLYKEAIRKRLEQYQKPPKLQSVSQTQTSISESILEEVSVVGDFNGWAPRIHKMTRQGFYGVWHIFIRSKTRNII